MSTPKTLKEITAEVGLPLADVRRRAARMGVTGYGPDDALPPELGQAILDFITQDLESHPLPAPAVAPTAPIEDVLERHTVELMSRPGVHGVGIGEDAAGMSCIQIYTESSPETVPGLPQELGGYPVRGRRVGRVVARKAPARTASS